MTAAGIRSWEHICDEFYGRKAEAAKLEHYRCVLEMFESSTPGNSKNGDIKLDIFDAKLKETIDLCDLIDALSNEELWYSYEQIKRRARENFHKLFGMQRLEQFVNKALKFSNEYNSKNIDIHCFLYENFKGLLKLSHSPDSYSSIFTTLSSVLYHQVQHSKCLKWKLEIFVISERGDIFVDYLLKFIFTLCSYNDPIDGAFYSDSTRKVFCIIINYQTDLKIT